MVAEKREIERIVGRSAEKSQALVGEVERPAARRIGGEVGMAGLQTRVYHPQLHPGTGQIRGDRARHAQVGTGHATAVGKRRLPGVDEMPLLAEQRVAVSRGRSQRRLAPHQHAASGIRRETVEEHVRGDRAEPVRRRRLLA